MCESKNTHNHLRAPDTYATKSIHFLLLLIVSDGVDKKQGMIGGKPDFWKKIKMGRLALCISEKPRPLSTRIYHIIL